MMQHRYDPMIGYAGLDALFTKVVVSLHPMISALRSKSSMEYSTGQMGVCQMMVASVLKCHSPLHQPYKVQNLERSSQV